MSYKNHVAELVKRSVEASPFSVKHVAEEALIARTTLSRKMNGSGEFTVPEIYRIAKVLGISVTALVPEEEAADEAA